MDATFLFNALVHSKNTYKQNNPLEYEEFLANNNLKDDKLIVNVDTAIEVLTSDSILLRITLYQLQLWYDKRLELYIIDSESRHKYYLVDNNLTYSNLKDHFSYHLLFDSKNLIQRKPPSKNLMLKILNVIGIKKTKNCIDLTDIITNYKSIQKETVQTEAGYVNGRYVIDI